MTVPHQSEAPVRERMGFFKNRGSSCKCCLSLLPNFLAASLRKIVSKLFCQIGTLATQARFQDINTFEFNNLLGFMTRRSLLFAEKRELKSLQYDNYDLTGLVCKRTQNFRCP